MISCVVFDFDGTLVLSNEIKRDTFFAVASGFEKGRERMDEILRSYAADRDGIFSRFAVITGVPDRAAALAGLYTQLCHEQICRCPERPGALETVSTLRSAGVRVYVNSSTPAAPLSRLLQQRFPDYFDGALGGYGCKLRNLHTIAAMERLEPNAVVMVGDGIDDREAAMRFGCGFVGVSGGTLPANPGTHLVDDLRDVLSILPVGKDRI